MQVWRWEPDSCTVACRWKGFTAVVGYPEQRYKYYRNELDVLRPEHVSLLFHPSDHIISSFKINVKTYDFQVIWRPYNSIEVESMNLSPMCERDLTYWRCTVPLLCYYIVEWHLPIRVMRQFGLLQEVAVAHVSTNTDLHM